jgi:hypothetical protein
VGRVLAGADVPMPCLETTLQSAMEASNEIALGGLAAFLQTVPFT